MMVHKKLIFFVLIIAITKNELSFGMHMIPPHTPSVKMTSFSMLPFSWSLWSLFFIGNKFDNLFIRSKFDTKVEEAKNDLVSEIKELNNLDASITNELEKNTKQIIEARLSRHFHDISNDLRASCGVEPVSKKIVNQRVVLTFSNEREAQTVARFLEIHEPQFERKVEKKREDRQIMHIISLKCPDVFIKRTKDDVLSHNQGEIQLASIKIEQLVESIKNLYNNLSYLYTSNSFERLFNKYGPDIDALRSFVNTKIHTLIHPDRHQQSPNLESFNRLTAVFTEDPRRQNPLTSKEFVHCAKDIIIEVKDYVKDPRNQQKLIAPLIHNGNITCVTATAEYKRQANELTKANAQVFCDTFVKKIEIDGYLRKKKKGQ